ncbi:MAG TPA: hypothetical protein VF574_14115 [Allosphingosinicella sp.]|jgi:hypothetical protein
MDAAYFLKDRTEFIRFFYDTGCKAYLEVKRLIEEELPPFDNPPYSEDGEPAYLEEWMDAESAIQLLGLACISLLSDSLKLYFHTLQRRIMGFSFSDDRAAFKNGFLAAYQGALAEILQIDWSDCPADLAVVEQIVLARNRSQHGSALTSFHIAHDGRTLEKHPIPFFASEEERATWQNEEGTWSSFLMPSVNVSREKLFAATREVEVLADFIDSHMGKLWEWRVGSASPA